MSQNLGAPSDNTIFTRAEQWLLLIVGAVQFVNILDFMMVMPLGPDFAKALDIPSSHLGQIAASYGISAALSGFAAATFLDRFDRRKALAVDPDTKVRNLKRLRRIEGQIRGLHKMVEDDRYCADILTQISSAHEALRAVGRELLRNHLKHCAASAIAAGGVERDAMYDELVDMMYKHSR